MRCCRAALPGLLAAGVVMLAQPAAAHDSWFQAQGQTARGELLLALGTGNRFPAYDLPVGMEHLRSSGCRAEGLRPEPLRRQAEQPPVLLLRSARPLPASLPLTCWAQLLPIDIGIENKTVEIYLDEIGAKPALRARWAAMRERGLPWQETYVKHARIEIDPEAGPAAAAVPPAPIEGLGMDAQLLAERRPVRAGDRLSFQVLRDGKPLVGQPMELQHERSATPGLWQDTDAEGRVSFTVAAPGRWLLRGTDVRPSSSHPGRWDSRFLTLAFDVRAAP